MSTPRYTHGHPESVLRSHRWRTAENSCGYLLPHLRPASGCSTSAPDPARSPPTSPSGWPRAGSPPSEANEDALALSRAELRRPRHRRRLRGRRRARARPARRLLRRRARPPGAPARRRPGAGAARDAPGLPAGRDGGGARQRLRGVRLVPASCRSWTVAGALPGGGPRQRRRARRRPAAAVLGPGRRVHRRHAVGGTWCFADPDDRAYWGGMWADRILSSALATQLVDDGLATTDELHRISEAWPPGPTTPTAGSPSSTAS